MIKNLSNFDDLPFMISVTDLADILNISRMGAYNLCHRKDFPSIRIGNRL
nr:helix-turn-helix domain-containing protein [Clostridiales bacterium]